MNLCGLYIHVPLCMRKCSYCSFCSTEFDLGTADEFAKALLTEMAMKVEGAPIRTVYAGGGTPTMLPPGFWKTFLGRLSVVSDTSALREQTIETNPGAVSPCDLETFRTAGFSRLSVGVQSFHQQELEVLGRIHDPDQAISTIHSARTAGFQSVCIDLIYGIPGQDLLSWRDSLDRTVELAPEHISCYELSLEPGTPLHGSVSRRERAKPSEEICREMYQIAHDALTDAGYLHYEVSNYALGEGSISLHNSSYWDNSPYIGLGPSAHSFDGKCLRSWNTSDIDGYLTLLGEGKLPEEGRETLAPEDMAMEMLMLGLRCWRGVDMNPVRELIGHAVSADHLERMIEAGRVVLEGSRIIPTTLGMLYADGDTLGLLG